MPIYLFLDANILLSFYALSNADISQLTQLQGVVKNGDIKLMINDQLRDEFQRNREVKIQESFKALRENNFKCQAPAFVKQMPDFLKLQEILSSANKQHAELVKIASELIESRQLEADKVVVDLIDASGVIPTDNNQYLAAYKRFLIGNPPGKKKVTIGDELNWEFLLDKVPNGQDLHLVTLDSDYASPGNSKKANAFILHEWATKNSSDLHFYRDLNDFFKLHIPKIKLANQAKISALISELAGSTNFSSTHEIVAKFPGEPEFNDSQIVELMNIKLNNSQVGWIEDDPDIAIFYAPIKARYTQLMASSVDKSDPAQA